MVHNCPCCSHRLIRHIRHQETYWFCRSCWQEMPLLDSPSLEISSNLSLEKKFANKTGGNTILDKKLVLRSTVATNQIVYHAGVGSRE